MRHHCIPQTFTVEQAAQWIQENANRTYEHIEKTPLSPEKRQELEHKSSLASRAIDRLEEVKKKFMEVLKNGTPDILDDGTPDPDRPYDVTIPPTKGLKALQENRKWADRQIELGHSEDITTIYMIPHPEDGMMYGVDIEGNPWADFHAEMTEAEHKKYGKLFKKDKKAKADKSVSEEEIGI